jgi:hypothetical protein
VAQVRSNEAGATASREEEIAFLAMEQVLGVEIKLADSGAGDKKPDGSWVYPGQERQGIVEITSPPATRLMTEWAREEGGSAPDRGRVDPVALERTRAGLHRDPCGGLG